MLKTLQMMIMLNITPSPSPKNKIMMTDMTVVNCSPHATISFIRTVVATRSLFDLVIELLA